MNLAACSTVSLRKTGPQGSEERKGSFRSSFVGAGPGWSAGRGQVWTRVPGVTQHAAERSATSRRGSRGHHREGGHAVVPQTHLSLRLLVPLGFCSSQAPALPSTSPPSSSSRALGIVVSGCHRLRAPLSLSPSRARTLETISTQCLI